MKAERKSVSIRIKLIGVIIPIVLVMVISYFALSRNMVLNISKDRLSAKAQQYAMEIDSWTNRIFGELKVYQDAIEEGGFENDEEILAYMETSVDKNEAYPVGLYMGDDSGVYLDGSGWVPGDDWVLEERDWYIDGMDNEEMAFGEPYYDSMTGQICVSASVRVDYDKAVRVLATDVYLDYVVGLVSNIAKEGDVEAFLVTKDSRTIIAHPDTAMLAQTLGDVGQDKLYANISARLNDVAGGPLSISGKDGRYYVCFNPVENTDWYLVTYVKESKVLHDLHWMELIMIVIAAVAAVLLIIAALGIMNRVVKPIGEMTGVIDRIADGDFSQNLEVKGNDEIARMSSNMNSFITKMQGTISEISSTAEWLKRQALDNESISGSLKDSSRNQAQSVEVLNELSDKLSQDASEISSQMSGLADLIRETRTQGEAADDLMKESVDMSQNGKDDIERIQNGMSGIRASIETLSEQVARMGDTTAQIGGMVNMIMDIAEETNLLSLNASIEAARAGEAGRGFAVVAEQIGKLAANSAVAADDISRLTEEITSTVEEAVEHMAGSVSEVHINADIVSEAGVTFSNLYKKVEETSRRVEQMIGLVEKVDVVADRMKQITESQAQAADRIVEASGELEESTESVMESSDAVAESAEELKKESIELMERMEQFQV